MAVLFTSNENSSTKHYYTFSIPVPEFWLVFLSNKLTPYQTLSHGSLFCCVELAPQRLVPADNVSGNVLVEEVNLRYALVCSVNESIGHYEIGL